MTEPVPQDRVTSSNPVIPRQFSRNRCVTVSRCDALSGHVENRTAAVDILSLSHCYRVSRRASPILFHFFFLFHRDNKYDAISCNSRPAGEYSTRDKSSYYKLQLADRFVSDVNQRDTRASVIAAAAQPTNRIFGCVIVAKLKGTVRQFRESESGNAIFDVRRENLINRQKFSLTRSPNTTCVLCIYYS